MKCKKIGRQACDLTPKRLSNVDPHHTRKACILSTERGIILAPLPLKGRGLGGLLKRRIIAASRHRRGVFFIGLDSYAVHSLMSAPRGNLSRLMFPFEHSANPCGVAHPLGGGVDGNQNRSKGVPSMRTNHQGESAPEVLTAETVQAFISHSLPTDVSDQLAERIKAASDMAYGILYRATEGAYHGKPWAPQLTESQRQDLEAFFKGIHRAVTLESVSRDWRKDHGVDADEDAEADHE